jgi:ABC-type polysaccharide/polyol phosphate export permease
MVGHLRYYYRQRHLLKVFVVNDLKSRFSGTAMGIYWSVLNPLLLIFIYTFVFSEILKVEFHKDTGNVNFALYLVCGLLPWLAVQDSIQRSTPSIVDNANLIKKPGFPASLLPIHIVISNLVTEAIGLVALIALVGMTGEGVGLKTLALPLIVIPQVMFTFGACWALASLQVLFRDIAPLLSSFLMLWMFLTPIFYPSAIFPRHLGFLLVINPMAHLVDIYRELIMKDAWPAAGSVVTLFVLSTIVFLAGYAIYVRLQPKFADLV